MEIKVQKNLFYTIGGVLVVIVISGVVWASRGGNRVTPYS